MKPIVTITFLITLMLLGAPMLNDTLTHTGSNKSATEISLSAGIQDAEKDNTTAVKPEVQSAHMQHNTDKATGTISGKNTANLIIIL